MLRMQNQKGRNTFDTDRDNYAQPFTYIYVQEQQITTLAWSQTEKTRFQQSFAGKPPVGELLGSSRQVGPCTEVNAKTGNSIEHMSSNETKP